MDSASRIYGCVRTDTNKHGVTATEALHGAGNYRLDRSPHLLAQLQGKEIQPMANASETLYRLKPVTYRFKKEIDTSQSLDYGLVAQILRPNFFSNSVSEIWIMVGRP
jgi:Chaperone of endosialidase